MLSRIRETWPLPDTELKPALALALAIEHAPMGVLLLKDDASGALELVVAEGLTDEQSSRIGPQVPGIGPMGLAFAEHRRVTVCDVLSDCDGDAADGMRDIARDIGFRALDVVPLTLADGHVIGALAAFFRLARRPSARSGRLAECCGRLMAVALDNARLRAEAEKRRESVEAMSRARVQFVARMSHELRTPLQSIIGYVDLLRLGLPDQPSERQKEMLEHVRHNERILTHVIDDLVSLARLEAGRVEYRIGHVIARDAILDASGVVAPLAQKHGIRLKVDRIDRDVTVTADEAKVKQVLINLLTNAVKFTPAGGTVGLTCARNGPKVVFEVFDTGHGIPADKLAGVFEPYVQHGTPVVDGLMGSGLGLAISREFAEGMRGELTARSAPGQGSVFTLRLPAGEQLRVVD